MIRCLLFGHEPHPTYEASRRASGGVTRVYTFCVRCSVGVTTDETLRPYRPVVITSEEHDAVLIDSLIDRFRVELTPNLMKAPRLIPRKTAEPTENGEG